MSHLLVLPRELTIYSVGELRPAWLARLATAGHEAPAEIDAAAVEEVDAAGVQLLLALSHTLAHEQRHELRLINASPTLQAACHALGLGRLLTAAAAAELA